MRFKIAFVGDWHDNGEWAVRAIEYARTERANVIVHAGDFSSWLAAPYLSRIELALKWAGLQLMFIDGNHDNHHRLAADYPLQLDGRRRITSRIFHLPRGYRWDWDGVTLMAMGGAQSVNQHILTPGLDWWPEETITDAQAEAAIASGPADVMITHDCPAGFTIPFDTRYTWPEDVIASSELHREKLATIVRAVQPRWLWHGHFHVRYDTAVDLGYGPLQVRGLDCDGSTLPSNVHVVDLDDLRADPR